MLSTLDIALRAASHRTAGADRGGAAAGFRPQGRSAARGRAGSGFRGLSPSVRQPDFRAAVGHANFVGASLIAIATGNIVVFWLFTRAVFDDAFEVRSAHASSSGLRSSRVSLVNCLLAGASMEWPSHLVGAGLNILALLFIAHGDRSDDRHVVGRSRRGTPAAACVCGDGRRSLRRFQCAAAAARRSPARRRRRSALRTRPSCSPVAGAIALSLTRLAGEDLFAEAASPRAGEPGRTAARQSRSFADRKLIDALNRLMAERRSRGARKGSPSARGRPRASACLSHRLRRLINDHLAHRNFAAFMNARRIDAAKAALTDPAQAQKSGPVDCL